MSVSSLIEQIKAAYPIAPFVAPHTGGLKASGRGFFIGRCPFHETDSKKPKSKKFWVNANGGTCGCFVPRCPAYCNATEDPTSKPLDVINFHALLNNISNEDAISDLAHRLDAQTGVDW